MRTVLRDRPVCLHISLIGSLSRKYKRLILANVPTLITPVSPVHNFDSFERTVLLTGVKFGWKLFPQRGQFWVAFNTVVLPAETHPALIHRKKTAVGDGHPVCALITQLYPICLEIGFNLLCAQLLDTATVRRNFRPRKSKT